MSASWFAHENQLAFFCQLQKFPMYCIMRLEGYLHSYCRIQSLYIWNQNKILRACMILFWNTWSLQMCGKEVLTCLHFLIPNMFNVHLYTLVLSFALYFTSALYFVRPTGAQTKQLACLTMPGNHWSRSRHLVCLFADRLVLLVCAKFSRANNFWWLYAL